MQGTAAVIEILNDVLTAELTAVNQYFIDAKMCADWGYQRLAEHHREESIGEMKDADRVIERILYLDGMPNMQRLGTVAVGEDVPEQLRLALDLERAAIARLTGAIELCTREGDHGTRDLFEEILRGEEEHADWLETQLHLIDELGEALYLAQQVGGG